MAKLKKRSKLSQQRQKANHLSNNKSGKSSNSVTGDAKDLQKITPLLQKLSAPASNDRSMALNSITLLCDNDPNLRKIFLKNDLIKLLTTKLLHDESDEVVVDSYGLLRNLIIEEGYDLSVHLWRSDIWTIFEAAYKKAQHSLDHVRDSNVIDRQRDMLIDFIENLVSCVGSLSSEVSIKLFHESVLPKLQGSGFLRFVVEIIAKKLSNKLTVVSLEFLYDLSTLSTNFIQLLSGDEEVKSLLSSVELAHSLSSIYMIGLHFQILEFTNSLGDTETFQILNQLMDLISTKVDLKLTIEQLDLPLKNENISKEEESKLKLAKENFKIIDIMLDLFSTIIEVKGEEQFLALQNGQPTENQFTKKLVAFYSQQLTANVLQPLILGNFKNNKVLICLNNLSFYVKSTDQVEEVYIEFLKSIRPILLPKLFASLQHFGGSLPTDGDELETLNDYLSHAQTSLELIPEILPEFTPSVVSQLISVSKNSAVPTDAPIIRLHINFTSVLLSTLSLIGKHCSNNELTAEITKFIVDECILKPLTCYEAQPVREAHKKYGYLFESILVEAINCIFELFDDDYSYNIGIYHDGGLGIVLKQTVIPGFKKVYKGIDKHLQGELKGRAEEAFMNLERFVQYKQTEI